MVPLGHTHQPIEATNTVVGMDDEVATAEALQLLQRESDLARRSLITAQGLLMVAVKELVLGEKYPAMLLINEALV